MARRTFYAKGQWNGGKGARSINSLITDYKKFVGVVDSECERIMQRAAEIQLEHTLPITPIQYGGLRASGRARAVQTNKGWAGIVSFGGDEAPVTPTPNAPDGIVKYAAVVNYGGVEDGRNSGSTMGENPNMLFMENGAELSRDDVDHWITTELMRIKP